MHRSWKGRTTFRAHEKNTDPAVQIERAKDADVIMLANMPLSGEVARTAPSPSVH